MANTYTQIHVQLIFAVRGRRNAISEKYREQIEKYICGVIKNKKSKPLAIYCNPDHCHVLIGLDPTISVSEIAGAVKSNSARWINTRGWFQKKFAWQLGYGAFTYSKTQIENVIKYILNQPIHHNREAFKKEYQKLLEEYEIKYNEKYIFDFND